MDAQKQIKKKNKCLCLIVCTRRTGLYLAHKPRPVLTTYRFPADPTRFRRDVKIRIQVSMEGADAMRVFISSLVATKRRNHKRDMHCPVGAASMVDALFRHWRGGGVAGPRTCHYE